MVLEEAAAFVDSVADGVGAPATWARAAAVALVGILLGWLVAFLARVVLQPLARRTRTGMDDLLLERTRVPLGLTIALAGLLIAGRLLFAGPEHATIFRALFLTGFLVIWGSAASRFFAFVLVSAAQRTRGAADTAHVRFLSRLVHLAVGVAILLTVLTVWDVEITPLLAGAGLAGIALALAAQDTLANFFAGVAIHLDHPYHVGDMVVIDQGSSGEVRGTVRDIGLRSTRILTRDDVLVTVPNSIIANGRIVNESAPLGRYRLRVRVSVSYDSDLERVERVLVRIAQEHRKVRGDPAPRARLRQFADSGIEWDLLAWIAHPEDRGEVVHELSLAIHRTFREEGIVIPFPQRDVRLVPAAP